MKHDFAGLFRAQVAARPDAPAVIGAGGRAVSYATLDAAARAIGAGLRRRGAGPGRVVGLCLEKSPGSVAALLGAWRAGAAFLPLDPRLPRARLAFMVKDAGATLVVADDAGRLALRGLGVRVMPASDWETGAGCPVPPYRVTPAPPGRLAYVIYTSGSTGEPKGVRVPHRGIVPLLRAQIRAFRLGPGARALWYHAPSFDASVSDLGTALASGAALCVEPAPTIAALLRVLRERRITHLDIPPALLRALDPATMPDSLETVVIGGEACPPETVRRWARRFRVVNVYGPTEATVCAGLGVCDPARWTEPLLGRPIPGTTFRVLDERRRPVERGTAGELYLGGAGLAIGYAGPPVLTASRFVRIRGERLYRTGDRVARRRDGEYRFLGRMDRQIKLRGLRIEPEEIEARLAELPGVREAVVVKRSLVQGPRSDGREGLAAFVAPANGRAPSGRALAAGLARSLPRWMVPGRFETLEALPRTPAGKVDLRALERRPLGARRRAGRAVPARTPEGRMLAEIWGRALGMRPREIGVDDAFGALGGDSLSAIEALAAAEARGIGLAPSWMREDATLGGLVAKLRRRRGGGSSEAVTASRLRADVAFDRPWRARLAAAARRPWPESRDAPPRAILLTGATGFLGARVLDELLRRTKAEIHCLVRAAAPAQGLARIREALGRHGRTLEGGRAIRVRALCGDLARPRLGLEAGLWRRLAAAVDTIFHCGAVVHLTRPYAVLRPANVAGALEVLRFQCAGRPKRLHYASTLSVFVATDRNAGAMREEDDLRRTRRVYGGYAQTKWAAEVLLRSARDAGGPVSYYRFGLLTGDARTGYSPPRDLFRLFVRGVAELGGIPRGAGAGLKVDVTPVDYAAAAMAECAGVPSSLLRCVGGTSPSAPGMTSMVRPRGRTFHIANPRSLSFRGLIRAVRRAGMAVEEVSGREWRARTAGTAGSAAQVALCRAFAGRGAYGRLRTMDLFQATRARFGMKNTRAALAGSGLRCPRPGRALLGRYVRAMVNDK